MAYHVTSIGAAHGYSVSVFNQDCHRMFKERASEC